MGKTLSSRGRIDNPPMAVTDKHRHCRLTADVKREKGLEHGVHYSQPYILCIKMEQTHETQRTNYVDARN